MVRMEKVVLVGGIAVVALVLTCALVLVKKSIIQMDNALYEVQRLSTNCSGAGRPYKPSTGSAN